MEKTPPKPRVNEPSRRQGEIRFEIPEDRLDPEHPARVLWDVVGQLDLSVLLAGNRAVQGRAGRSRLSPQMLLTLWLYAISQGVGSAREIARRTRDEVAFRWIVGDLEVGHHKLSQFRRSRVEAFDQLLSDVLGSLMHLGVLSLKLVAQDGMRVRASASAPSFRRLASLEQCREQAALHLKAVMAQAKEHSQTQQARRETAARDFQQRVEEAISTVHELQAGRKPSQKEPRASTTDPEARVMKMADGGFRPAYNVQMATAGSEMGGPRTIVGVRVTNVGSDMSAVSPMLDEIERRTGQLPETLLADANHGAHAGITDAAERGVEMLVAVPKRSKKASAHTNEDHEIVAWRERMKTEEAQRTYRARAGLCELTNAHARQTGFQQILVRGIEKVTSVALLSALSYNLLQHATTLLS